MPVEDAEEGAHTEEVHVREECAVALGSDDSRFDFHWWNTYGTT